MNQINKKFLPGLKSSDTKTQLKTIREFHSSLLNDLKGLKHEEEPLLFNCLIAYVKEVYGNKRNHDNIQACVFIIASVINLDKVYLRPCKFHQQDLFIHLRNILKYDKENTIRKNIIEVAARTLGRLVMAGVECEIEFKNGLEYLRSNNQETLFFGIITIRELVLASPSRLILHADKFFQDIMIAITDESVFIRHKACELFSLSLNIIISRDTSVRYIKNIDTANGCSTDDLKKNITNRNTSKEGFQLIKNNGIKNDYIYRIIYKECFNKTIEELNLIIQRLNFKDSKEKLDEFKHIIHGYLLILIEVFKLSSVEFEKEIENGCIFNSIHKETELKSKEFYPKYSFSQLPNLFESNEDPFSFLYESRDVKCAVESIHFINIINDNHVAINSLLKNLVKFDDIHIQKAILELLPRLVNFYKKRNMKFYLNGYIQHFLDRYNSKIEQEVLTFLRLLSKNIDESFNEIASHYFNIIKSSIIETFNNENSSSFFTDILNKFVKDRAPSRTIINGYNKNREIIMSDNSKNEDFNLKLACLLMCAKSVPIENSLRESELIEFFMQRIDLTCNMITFLKVIMKSVPNLNVVIHINLLEVISQRLTGFSFPEIIERRSNKNLSSDRKISVDSSILNYISSRKNAKNSSGDNNKDITNNRTTDDKLIIQALQALRSFEFSSICLISLLPYCEDNYLKHESSEVKFEVVLTISTILDRLIRVFEHEGYTAFFEIVSSTIRKLFDCVCVDTNPDVQYHILSSLNQSRFSLFMTIPYNFDFLCLFLRDQRFEIRELSASIISKVTVTKPANANKFLRVIIERLLKEIKINSDVPLKETTVRLIGHIFSCSHFMTNLYAKPLLESLHLNLIEYRNNIRFSSCVITTIGRLASQSRLETFHDFSSTIPFLIESMQDMNYIQLKHASLWTIGQIIANTGYVIEPYRDYPRLFKILLGFLQNDENLRVRREVIRIIGLIGAIDPYDYKQSVLLKLPKSNSVKNELNCDLIVSKTKIVFEPSEIMSMIQTVGSLDEYYPILSINILIKIIKYSIDLNQVKDTLNALDIVLKNLSGLCRNYIQFIIPKFLELTKNINENIVICIVTKLTFFIDYFGKSIDPYISSILKIVQSYFNISKNQAVISGLINLMQKIQSTMSNDYKKYISQTIPIVFKKLKQEIYELKTVYRPNLLALIINCSPIIESFTNLILTQFIEILLDNYVDVEVKKQIMLTIHNVAENVTLTANASILYPCFSKLFVQYLSCFPTPEFKLSPMVQTESPPKCLTNIKLIFSEDLKNANFMLLVFEALYVIAKQNNSIFFTYEPVFDKILSVNETYSKLFKRLTSYCNNAINMKASQEFFDTIQLNNNEQTLTAGMNQSLKISPGECTAKLLDKSQNSFEKVTNLEDRFDEAENLMSCIEWRESFNKFQKTLVEETTNLSLKIFGVIKDFSIPNDLFNACFINIWRQLAENEQNKIVHYLELALTKSDDQDMIECILNLKQLTEWLEIDLNIDLQILADKAFSVRAYAKSLYFVEQHFLKNPSSEFIEQLVVINQELQLMEAATGAVDYGIKTFKNTDFLVKQHWNEKLHNWKTVFSVYEDEFQPPQTKIKTKTSDLTVKNLELIVGKMRCLKGLGEWNKVNYACLDMKNFISQLSDTHKHKNHLNQTRLEEFKSPTIYHEQQHLNKQQEENLKCKISEIGLSASWGLSDWENMDEYDTKYSEKSYEGSLYRAVLSINNNEFNKTVNYLQDARDILDRNLTSIASFQSYDRAFPAIIEAQVLSELEEVIAYKTTPSKRENIEKIWSKRLQGCEKSLEHWNRLLLVRSIVLPKEKNLKPWLKYSNMCRKAGLLNQSDEILKSLLNKFKYTEEEINFKSNFDYENCKYAHLKCLASFDLKKVAHAQMFEFVTKHLEPQYAKLVEVNGGPVKILKYVEIEKVLSKCYLKLGRWQYDLDEGMKDSNISKIISYYHTAKEKHKDWYKAWNAWAYANYEALKFYKTSSASSSSINDTVLQIDFNHYLIPALEGFVKSIKLSPKTELCKANRLEDTLRYLSLCFEYCNSQDIYQIISDGIESIPLEVWLQVIPQLIAHFSSNNSFVITLLQQLFINLGLQYPQAIIHHIILASESSNTRSQLDESSRKQEKKRIDNAKIILESLREYKNKLVEQAELMNEELIRVAILWNEKFRDILGSAYQIYTEYRKHEESQKFIVDELKDNEKPKLLLNAMFDELIALDIMIERGEATCDEKEFLEKYGVQIKKVRYYYNQYKQNNTIKEFEDVWPDYHQLLLIVSKEITEICKLDLNKVSPKLMLLDELELAIPGTYSPNKPLVKIKSLNENIKIIKSKQRPRKISIQGSDGREYPFLLKGNEDLRQDERVMQLFGLVNNLLLENNETSRRDDFTIQRFNVIPLSESIGLLEWLDNCDTLQMLIHDYRKTNLPDPPESLNLKFKTSQDLINLEYNIIKKLNPYYEVSTSMQKLGVFERTLQMTVKFSYALAKVLFIKSLTIEKWLERRVNYIRSLAVMSMVGYILGLGDRHPSNIMIDCATGKIVHIDFGDCFETAMTRDVFPEKVPFRLTRMLINAMESTGVEGTFRHTSESVMKLLRNNRECIMNVLEAFIYDPILSCKLADVKHSSDRNINLAMPLSSDTTNVEYGSNGRHVNTKALAFITRVKDKLTGHDFGEEEIDVHSQVDLLISQATSPLNLCQSFMGWCSWW